MKLLLIVFAFSLFSADSFYELSFAALSGENISMQAFKGKKVLVVNVATEGDNSQLLKLDSLARLFKDKLVVIVVPSNSFGHEPKSNAELEQYFSYEKRFYVSKKTSVSGANAHPIFQWLSNPAKAGELAQPVKVDYQKYLIDEGGNVIGVLSPRIDPCSKEMKNLVSGTPVEIGIQK